MSPSQGCPLLCLSLVLLWASDAFAWRVAIVRTDYNDAVEETISRIHGELLAVGFDVAWAESASVPSQERGEDPDPPRTLALADLDAENKLDAAIEVVGNAPQFEVAVWLLEPSRPPRLIRVEPAGPERAPGKVAIQAVEALRSALLEGGLAGPPRPAEPPARNPVRDVLEEAAAPSESFGLALGAATLMGLDGVGPAITPWLELDYALGPRFLLKATAAAFGSRPTVTAGADRAQVAQDFALLGGAYRFGEEWRLKPFLALSAGVLKTQIQGIAAAPGRAHSETQYSLLTQASLGVDVHLVGPYFTSLAGHVQLARPSVAVHLRDTLAATTGQPNLVLGLTAGVWL